MTIKQYQKLATVIAEIIKDNDGNVNKVRNLKFTSSVKIGARNPKLYKEHSVSIKSGNNNTIITFDTISNPNNPNAAFRTLKPGSISLYDSATNTNVDASDFRFDSAQFADLIFAIQTATGLKMS